MLDSRIFTMKTIKQISMIFASNNLFQRVPDGVVNVKSLTHVSFPFNKIISVGHSLCSCTTLVHLDLSNKQIATLASEFSHLWNLKFLNFGANSFETVGDSIRTLSACATGASRTSLSQAFWHISWEKRQKGPRFAPLLAGASVKHIPPRLLLLLLLKILP